MKKQIPFLVLGTLLLVLLASCEKEADDQAKGYFKLTTEKHQSPNKTSVESTTVEWVNGDTVHLYVGESHENNYEVYTVDDEAFVYLEEGNENDPVRAYYPKTIIASGGNTNSPTVVFPNSYNSRYSGGRQVLALPMVAKGVVRDKKIVFKHLSAAIKVTVNNGTDSVLTFDSVVVSSRHYLLGGTMNLDLDQGDYGITASTTSDSNAVTVHLTDAPTIAPGGTLTVQVPIRPIGEAALRIEVFAHCLSNKKKQNFRNTSGIQDRLLPLQRRTTRLRPWPQQNDDGANQNHQCWQHLQRYHRQPLALHYRCPRPTGSLLHRQLEAEWLQLVVPREPVRLFGDAR